MNIETKEFSFMKDVPVVQPKEKDYFFEGYFKGKPRPTDSSKEVITLVVQRIMPEIIGWFQQFEVKKISEEDIENIKKQLEDILYNDNVSELTDAYEIAKSLDNHYYWEPDSGLVDILCGLEFYDIRNFLTNKWFKDNNITPKYKEGDNVIVKSSHLRKSNRQKEQYNGEISKVFHEEGKYCIYIEELGHVKNGSGTIGIILSWELIDN